MWNRVRALFRAGLQAQRQSGAWPAAPLMMHGSITAALCLLVRDELPPFAYGVFALSVSGALLALPLLGDFGALLRADTAHDWIEAQPVRASELRLARTLMILLLVGMLAAASLIPIAVFAPHGLGFAQRAELVLAGFGQALLVSALLIAVQSLLGERAEAALVVLQTLLVAGVVMGFVVGLRFVPTLVHVETPSALPAWYPSAWFASVVTGDQNPLAWIATGAAIAVLASVPLPPASRARRAGWLALVLAPVRALATRAWVRREERGSFDLVFDALPLEREFVLRTYPMIGIPLAMLFAGSRSASASTIERDGLIALLLFTPATYLPILLVHVPATASAEARWILDSAPVSRAAIANGALKALAVRFVVPLYVLLFALAWSRGGLEFALRLAPVGFLVTLIVLRKLYPMCVADPPLSIAHSEVEARTDWTGTLLTLGVVLAVLAVVALELVTSLWIALIVCAVLVALERLMDRAALTEA